MKPNDKAIEADAVREVKSILNTISPITDNETIAQNIVGKIIAAYAAQFPPNDQYAGFVEMLRSPAMAHYEYDADQGAILQQAADILEAVLAERDTVRKELIDEIKRLDRERIAWKGQQEETAALLKQVEAERDALLARLAPEDDEALVEIAAKAISKQIPCLEVQWGDIRDAAIDAIAAIRPHIEAAERERCAKIADKQEWCAGSAVVCGPEIAAAIRSGK